jgi:hypothetical protein
VNEQTPSPSTRDPFSTGEEMLERAKQVSRSVDERIHKIIDQANRLAEHIDSYSPASNRLP